MAPLPTLLTRLRMLSFTSGSSNSRMKRTKHLRSRTCAKNSLLRSQQPSITSVHTQWWTWLSRMSASQWSWVSSRPLTSINSCKMLRTLPRGQQSSPTSPRCSLKLLAAPKWSKLLHLQMSPSTKARLTIVFTGATDSMEWPTTARNHSTLKSCGDLCQFWTSHQLRTILTDGVNSTTATSTSKTQQTAGSQLSAPRLLSALSALFSGLLPSFMEMLSLLFTCSSMWSWNCC